MVEALAAVVLIPLTVRLTHFYVTWPTLGKTNVIQLAFFQKTCFALFAPFQRPWIFLKATGNTTAARRFERAFLCIFQHFSQRTSLAHSDVSSRIVPVGSGAAVEPYFESP